MLCVCQSPERMILTKANCSKRKEGESGNWGMEKKSEPSKFVPMRDEHHNPGDHLETEASQCMHSHLYTFASHTDKQHVQRAEESRLHANLCDFFFHEGREEKIPELECVWSFNTADQRRADFDGAHRGLHKFQCTLTKPIVQRSVTASPAVAVLIDRASRRFDFTQPVLISVTATRMHWLCVALRPCSNQSCAKDGVGVLAVSTQFPPGSGRKHSKARPSGPFLTRTFHSTSIQSGRKNFQFRQLKAISRCAVRDSVQQPAQCC